MLYPRSRKLAEETAERGTKKASRQANDPTLKTLTLIALFGLAFNHLILSQNNFSGYATFRDLAMQCRSWFH
jgi:hypothetical protein